MSIKDYIEENRKQTFHITLNTKEANEVGSNECIANANIVSINDDYFVVESKSGRFIYTHAVAYSSVAYISSYSIIED